MPLIRHIRNRSGAEGFVIGLTPQDDYMLRKHGMCQIDIRTFAVGAGIMSSIVILRGETEAEILAAIDPTGSQIVVQDTKVDADHSIIVEKPKA